MTNPVMIKVLTLAALYLTGFPDSQEGNAAELPREGKRTDAPLMSAGNQESVLLQAGGKTFLASHREAVAKITRGGVILVQGFDTAPLAVDILRSLHNALPEHGWDTLALHGPVKETEADFHNQHAHLGEAIERVGAGVAYLRIRNQARIAVIGQGSGARILLRYLAEKPDPKVYAAIIIEPTLNAAAESDGGLGDLGKVHIPLLDIPSGHGRDLANEATKARKRIMKSNDGYQQTIIADPQHDFKDVEGLLVNRIHGWLTRTAATRPQATDGQPIP